MSTLGLSGSGAGMTVAVGGAGAAGRSGFAVSAGAIGFLAAAGGFAFAASFLAGGLLSAGFSAAGGVSDTCATAEAVSIRMLARITIGRTSFIAGAIPVRPWLCRKPR